MTPSRARELSTDNITSRIIGAAIDVHRHLGPGLLEVDCSYRIDLLVENAVVVEVKAVKALSPVHVSQVLTYLRMADLRVGLLFNFNVDVLAVGGWKRVLRKR